MVNSNNATKPLVIIIAVIAVITGIASVFRPLQQQIKFLSTQLRDHTNQNNHPWGVIAEVAELNQKFVEVETQFNGVREVIEMKDVRDETRIEKLEEWQRWWQKNMAIADATQNEKISQLEERIKNLVPRQ